MSTITYALAYMSAALFQAKESREDKGATAVEYGLLVALIAAIIIVAVALLGQNILDAFDKTNDNLKPATPSATPTT